MNLKLALVPVALLIVLAANNVSHAQPRSRLLLGIYSIQSYQGLQVTGTIPGYSARGRLFSGDVLRRVTTDGYNIYPTRSHYQFEYAKDRIGPFQPAALEVFRPGVGLVYLWVTFRPVGVVQAYSHDGSFQPSSSGATEMRAEILTEREKPGARALFGRGGQSNTNPNGGFNPGGGVQPNTGLNPGWGANQGNQGASSLFGK